MPQLPHPAWLRRPLAHARSPKKDRGGGSVEFAVIFPAVLLLVFAIIEAGLFFHARSVAARAAQIGVDAGRSYDAQPGAGENAARGFLARTGKSVDRPEVAEEIANGQISVTVTGHVISLVPGMDFEVNQRVQAPVEEFQ